MVYGVWFRVYTGPKNITIFYLVWSKNLINLDQLKNCNFKNKKIKPDHLDCISDQIFKLWFGLICFAILTKFNSTLIINVYLMIRRSHTRKLIIHYIIG